MDLSKLDSLKGKLDTLEGAPEKQKAVKKSVNGLPMNWKHLASILHVDENNFAFMQGIENALYDKAREVCTNYAGGQWRVATLGSLNYVYPEYSVPMQISVASNYYEGEMDAKTFGFALTMWLVNTVSWTLYNRQQLDKAEELSELYHTYRGTIFDDNQKELDAAAINRFLD